MHGKRERPFVFLPSLKVVLRRLPPQPFTPMEEMCGLRVSSVAWVAARLGDEQAGVEGIRSSRCGRRTSLRCTATRSPLDVTVRMLCNEPNAAAKISDVLPMVGGETPARDGFARNISLGTDEVDVVVLRQWIGRCDAARESKVGQSKVGESQILHRRSYYVVMSYAKMLKDDDNA